MIATTPNPKLNYSIYFTISLNESAINPEYFGPNQGNFTVFFVYNLSEVSGNYTNFV